MADRHSDTERWIEDVTGCRVVSSAALVGGVSSSVHRCRLSDGRDVVVRHIDDAAWLAREPHLIPAEASALRLAAADGLPVPAHLASDRSKGRLLMSLLPGRPRIDIDHLVGTVDRFGELAAGIADVDLGTDGQTGSIGHPRFDLPSWRPWAPAKLSPPSWGSHPLWERAIAAYQARPPTGSVTRSGIGVLLHRDLHPLNLLWQGDHLAGVVDWVNACVGHPHAEISHARLNLAILGGRELADEFLVRYLGHAAVDPAGPYDPRWDLETPMSFLAWPPDGSAWRALGRTDLTDERVWSAVEMFVAVALDEL